MAHEPLSKLLAEILLKMLSPMNMASEELAIAVSVAELLSNGLCMTDLTDHKFFEGVDWTAPRFTLEPNPWHAAYRPESGVLYTHAKRSKWLLANEAVWENQTNLYMSLEGTCRGASLPLNLPHVIYPKLCDETGAQFDEPGMRVVDLRHRYYHWTTKKSACVIRALLEIHKTFQILPRVPLPSLDWMVHTQKGLKLAALPVFEFCKHANKYCWSCHRSRLYNVCKDFLGKSADNDDQAWTFLKNLQLGLFANVEEALQSDFVAQITEKSPATDIFTISDYDEPSVPVPRPQSLITFLRSTGSSIRLPIAVLVYGLLEYRCGRPIPAFEDIEIDEKGYLRTSTEVVKSAALPTDGNEWIKPAGQLYTNASHIALSYSKHLFKEINSAKSVDQLLSVNILPRVYYELDGNRVKVNIRRTTRLITNSKADSPFYDGRKPYVTLRQWLEGNSYLTADHFREIVQKAVSVLIEDDNGLVELSEDAIFICPNSDHTASVKFAYMYNDQHMCKSHRSKCWSCVLDALAHLTIYVDQSQDKTCQQFVKDILVRSPKTPHAVRAHAFLGLVSEARGHIDAQSPRE